MAKLLQMKTRVDAPCASYESFLCSKVRYIPIVHESHDSNGERRLVSTDKVLRLSQLAGVGRVLLERGLFDKVTYLVEP